MIKFIYTLVFLILTIGSSFGQDDLEIITFDDDGPRTSRNIDPTFLVIKTNPLSMISGRQFVEIEYPILDFLSVEGGLGLTFNPVIGSFQNVYTQIYNELTTPACSSTNFEPGFDICDQAFYNDFSIRNTNLGGWISTGIKFYYYNTAPEDAYISLNLKYHTNNYDVLQAQETNVFVRELDVYADETVRNFDYSVRAGFQTLFSPLTTDAFIGVGIRSRNETRLDIGLDRETSLITNKFQTLSSSTILLEAGIRIGLEVTRPATTSSKKKKKKKKRRRRR